MGSQNVLEHLIVQPDGKLLVTGWIPFDFSVMRLDTGGNLDPTWTGDGRQTVNVVNLDRAYAAALMSDTRLVLAGGTANDTQMALARFLGDGSLVQTTATAIASDAPDPSTPGQSFLVGITVTATGGAAAPLGTVAVGDGVQSASCALTLPPSGLTSSASCSLALTTLGGRTLTASFPGDGVQFCPSTSNGEPHVVQAAATTTAITSDAPDPSVVGQTVLVQYTVTSTAGTPTGTVTVSDGVDSCSASVATGQCSLALTTVGVRTLTASYGGDVSFAASAASTSHAVGVATTTTTITGDTPDPSAIHTAITVGWTVAVDPPGGATPSGDVTVTVSGGGETCSAPAGIGGCSLLLTALGSRTLTASYAGDAVTAASTDGEPHEVVAGTSTTTISSHLPEPSVTGQQIDVTFAVASGSGTPTGTVSVDDGQGGSCSAPRTGGAGSCALSPSHAGALTLTAAYSGDGLIAASLGTAVHQVDPAATTVAILGVAPEPSPPGNRRPCRSPSPWRILAPAPLPAPSPCRAALSPAPRRPPPAPASWPGRARAPSRSPRATQVTRTSLPARARSPRSTG